MLAIRSSSPGDHSNCGTHRATVRRPVTVAKTLIIDELVHTSSGPVGREGCSTGWADCRLPRAKVFEGTQHVVVPPGWKGELQPGWVDDLTSALTSEQLSLKEVLFTPSPSRDEIRRATGCALICQQSF